jgi:hypothetical protein
VEPGKSVLIRRATATCPAPTAEIDVDRDVKESREGNNTLTLSCEPPPTTEPGPTSTPEATPPPPSSESLPSEPLR